MATNLEVMSDALHELNVIAETQTASAEQGLYGLRKQNNMLEAWTEDGIQLGYFAQSVASDTCPVPAYALRAVIACLAVEIAPRYKAVVSPELAMKAQEAYLALLRKSLVESAEPADMSHMPQGSGYGSFRDITR